MNLSENIAAGLKLLGNNCAVTDEGFVKLLQMHTKIILGKKYLEVPGIMPLYGSRLEVIKAAGGALLTLLIEATKHNTDADTLSSFLNRDMRFIPARTEKLVKCYMQNRSQFEAVLSCIGSHPPHIVDSNWTLDYCIKTSSLEHVGVMQYLIQFHLESCDTSDKSERQVVRFLCSSEELQNLVGQQLETRWSDAIFNTVPSGIV